MISVADALHEIQNIRFSAKKEHCILEKACGRVLAEDIVATQDAPAFNSSAMDGFALHHSINVKVGERLKIVGESQAGKAFSRLQNHGVIRISTGAQVPEGYNRIFPVEVVSEKGEAIVINKIIEAGKHIRKKGEEYAKGVPLLHAGTEITPGRIALMAANGIKELLVFARPQIALLISGSEVVNVGNKLLGETQIWDTNTPMLTAAIKQTGAELTCVHHIADNEEKTKKILAQALEKADLILTTGGVSMGIHDHIRTAALSTGFNEIFWKVRQKPGKPLFFAHKKGIYLLALPGNPVSAYICYKHYANPIINAMQQKQSMAFKPEVLLSSSFENRLELTRFIRVKINPTTLTAEILEMQGSHMAGSIANADGYITVLPKEKIEKGTKVRVTLFKE